VSSSPCRLVICGALCRTIFTSVPAWATGPRVYWAVEPREQGRHLGVASGDLLVVKAVGFQGLAERKEVVLLSC